MQSQNRNFVSRPVSRRRRGLSIIEVMISLTISAFLLVAVAAAYSASADAVEMNDKFFRATQAGRVTMNQLLTEIRRADSVDVIDSRTINVIRPAPGAAGGSGTSQANETFRTFAYDPATKQVTLQIHYKATAPSPVSPVYPLARNVDAAVFGPAEYLKDAAGVEVPGKIVVRVPVQLVVRIASNEVRLSGASGPRRAAVE
jgi:prepilin-type N-terminal cleavage/methylation domain-containing protein